MKTPASATGVVRAAPLGEHDLVYRLRDALYLQLHADGEPAEGVLVAWGVAL